MVLFAIILKRYHGQDCRLWGDDVEECSVARSYFFNLPHHFVLSFSALLSMVKILRACPMSYRLCRSSSMQNCPAAEVYGF